MAKVRACPKWLISGIHEAGYYVYFYIAGTSTPKDTYTDNTESAANTNPVILDARGEADIWLSGTYKVSVYTGDKDADGVLVWSVDNYGAGESQVQIGEFNLVKNGSFETDVVSNGEPDTWTIVDYPTGSHELDSTDQYHGLNSLKFTSTGAGGGYATSDYFEVQEAKEVFVDWSMRSSVADVRNVVDIIWYTSAKTAISTTNIYDDSATNPTSWTAKAGSGVPVSTARYAQFRIYGCHSSDATSGSTWFDDVVAQELTVAATQTEVDAGTNTAKFVTPATLGGVISSGTFTPSLEESNLESDLKGQTYTARGGWWTQIGNLVTVTGYIEMSSLGTLTTSNPALINSAVPVNPGNSHTGGLVFTNGTSLAISAGSSITAVRKTSTTSMSLKLWDSAGGTTDLLLSEITASGALHFYGQYIAAT
jgi:hypothetical protein